MPWHPAFKSIPNLVVDGYYDGYLSACSDCKSISSDNLKVQGRWDGVFRPLIHDGAPYDPPIPDYWSCEYDRGSATGTTATGAASAWTQAIIDGKHTLGFNPVLPGIGTRVIRSFGQPTVPGQLSGTPWILEVACTDEDAAPGAQDFVIWKGQQKTANARNPAGWYDYIEGCASDVPRMHLSMSAHDPCPCDAFDGTCPDRITGVNDYGLQIKNFNIEEWSPGECTFLNCREGPFCGGQWGGQLCPLGVEGVDPYTICTWDSISCLLPLDLDNPGCAFTQPVFHMTLPHGDCEAQAAGSLVEIYAIARYLPTQGYSYLYVHLARNSPTETMASAGTWAKDVGDTALGIYRKVDQADWGFVSDQNAPCTDTHCDIGPDILELV